MYFILIYLRFTFTEETIEFNVSIINSKMIFFHENFIGSIVGLYTILYLKREIITFQL
jgi:hypothetical protein